MSVRSARFVLSVIAVAGIGAASADDLAGGTFGCFTRGGREIESRRFTLGDDGSYGKSGQDGSVVQNGRRVYFRGGAFGGREGLVLPDGGIRLSRTCYCFRLPEVAAPVPVAAPEPVPAKPSPPPARLIKVQRPAPDPHVIHIAP